MKLFLISQTKNCGYDTHDSAVVVADDEAAARQINPSWGGGWGDTHSTWCGKPEDVSVEYLGEARDGMPSNIVLASFNAG